MQTAILIKWALAIGIPLLCLLLYRLILRVFFGLVIVPEDKIGLVTKKYVLVGKQSLPEGRIIASNGEAAKADAEKISLTGNAEAEKTLAIGKSSAESYKLAVEAMGGDNFTQLKVMEAIGSQHIRIMPDVLVGGGDGGGPINGLLGLQLLEQLGKKPKES